MENLAITRRIEYFLYNSYDPKVPDRSGYLLAGLSPDRRWESNTAVGGNALYTLLLSQDQNIFCNDGARIVPWFQYKGKAYGTDLSEFVEENIRGRYPDFIVLKPTRATGKRYFDMDHNVIEEVGFVEARLDIIDKVGSLAERRINSLMEAFIMTGALPRTMGGIN